MQVYVRRTVTGIVCFHSVLVGAFLAVTWGLGLDFTSVWISNVGRFAVVMLPVSLIAVLILRLAAKRPEPVLTALLVLGSVALFIGCRQSRLKSEQTQPVVAVFLDESHGVVSPL